MSERASEVAMRAIPPRLMTDTELRVHFGLTDRALRKLRFDRSFPRKDVLIGKTDRKAVDAYFDRRSGISHALPVGNVADGEENWT